MSRFREEIIGDARLILGDCREVLPTLLRVDAVVTDPPYMFTTASAGGGKLNPWADMVNSAVWYADMIKLCRARLPLDSGVIWWFLNWKTLPVLQKAVFDNRWQIESLLVWDKEWIGPGGPNGLRPSYELVALMVNEGGGLKNRGLPDIWRHQWASARPSGHPAEKPLSLMFEIVAQSPGQSVLDPFMGSGTTGVACAQQGRPFVGIEMDDAHFDLACRRIEEAWRQPRLFDEPKPKATQETLQFD